MLRKLFIYLFLGAIVAGIAYGYLYYGVVGIYEPGQPKITYLCLVEKPAREVSFFYNHIDERMTKREIEVLKNTNRPIPWHLNYTWVINNAIYIHTMDNRNLGK